MNIEILQSKWNNLASYNNLKEYKSLRISSDCKPDLFIGLNNDKNKCLILLLPNNHRINFKKITKEHLTIELFKETNYIILLLTNNSYYDLFDELCLSLYNKIKNITDVDEYGKEFIQTFYKWTEFFSDQNSFKMSDETIKGLFGELLVLRQFIAQSNSDQIDSILNSWKGPYDLGNDFDFDQKKIEVKTKDVSKTDIRISSEFQLEKEKGNSLELWVLSIETSTFDGISLSQLIIEIKSRIIEKLGDGTIFLKALRQKGISFKNMHEYDSQKFKPINLVTYNCCDEKFPKLVKSKLPDSISKVQYNIRVTSISRFILSESHF